MFLLYQIPGEKCEERESARQGAVREIFKETGIDLKPRRLKFITYDSKFDCNIYTYKILNITSKLKKLEEMSAWY